MLIVCLIGLCGIYGIYTAVQYASYNKEVNYNKEETNYDKEEVNYNKAIEAEASGDYKTAYDLFLDLGDYSDSKEKLEDVRNKMYAKAVEAYRNGDIDAAIVYFFNYTSGIGHTDKYKILIAMQRNGLNANFDLNDILDMVDLNFKDVKTVLAKNDYWMEKFLLGNWISGEDYIKFTKNNDGSNECSYTLPNDVIIDAMINGNSYKVEDGVQYYGDDTTGWTKTWEYEIVSQNEINVKFVSTGKTLKFARN